MDLLVFIALVSGKLHILKPVGKLVNLFPFHPPKNMKCAGLGDAKSILRSVSPDNGSSCICDEEHEMLEEEYDLEVIIPAYNVEKYIVECIDSVLSQKTNYSYHLIIINDGSTDDTRNILRRYEGDNRITVVDQTNKGLSEARNTGIRLARGRYLMFVDSDDRLADDAIENLMRKAMNGNYDLVVGGYSRFRGNHVFGTLYPTEDSLLDVVWGRVFRRDLWRGIQFPKNYWFEDSIGKFIMHEKAASVAAIPIIVYEYRKTPSGITSVCRGNPKSLDSLYIIGKLMADRVKLGLPLDGKCCNTLLWRMMVALWRVRALRNPVANYALFIYFKSLYEKCYKDYIPNGKRCKKMAEALIGMDYKKYLIACMFGDV